MFYCALHTLDKATIEKRKFSTMKTYSEISGEQLLLRASVGEEVQSFFQGRGYLHRLDLLSETQKLLWEEKVLLVSCLFTSTTSWKVRHSLAGGVGNDYLKNPGEYKPDQGLPVRGLHPPLWLKECKRHICLGREGIMGSYLLNGRGEASVIGTCLLHHPQHF